MIVDWLLSKAGETETKIQLKLLEQLAAYKNKNGANSETLISDIKV